MASLHPRFSFYRGDTWEITGPLFYADGMPFDLGPGASLVWELEDGAGAMVLALTLNAGIVLVDPSDTPPNRCLITVTPAQSAAIAPGVYKDQLRATDPGGFVSTQTVGSIEVRKSFFV